jgi:hypothetical protein
MIKIKDYSDLFALGGYWRKKRAEKKIYFTDKSHFRLGNFGTKFRRFLISIYDCAHKTDKRKSVSVNAILIALQKF